MATTKTPAKARPMKLHVFEGVWIGEKPKQRWRWNLMAPNGRLICTSGEPFSSRAAALKAAARMQVLLLEVNYTKLIVGDAA